MGSFPETFNDLGFLLVLFFFHFPMQVGEGHIHSSRGESLALHSLNESPGDCIW